jgi:transposase-like protein
MSILDRKIFGDDAAAYEFLESVSWPQGPNCPHCGAMDRLNRLAGVRSKPSKAHPEGVVRHGLWKCYHCRKQFTVTVGTVFESSHVPLHKWLQAAFLLCSSKKGISSHQLHRILQVTYKTAWFMAHRLREAMRDGGFSPIGGDGKTIEVDETYFGPGRKVFRDGRWKGTQGLAGKIPIVTLIERGGRAYTVKFDHLSKRGLEAHLIARADMKSHLRTDESNLYKRIGTQFASHEAVNHSVKEYVRGDAYTNTAEGFFSIFKRGMRGVYQHCGKQHLNRYLTEFDFRYNSRKCDDLSRSILALTGIKGKRLTYKGPSAP